MDDIEAREAEDTFSGDEDAHQEHRRVRLKTGIDVK